MVVIEGPKAGGHLGFDRAQLNEFNQKTYDQEVIRILRVVKEYREKYDVNIPVALAGGITHANDVQHAFRLGVDAVQVASRFVTTMECDADIESKKCYLNANEKDIAIVQSPVGMPGRAILNPFMTQIMNGLKQTPKRCMESREDRNCERSNGFLARINDASF